MDDVIIIGGSFAGLSAALPLLRARRKVRIIDAGAPRNRMSPAAHGVFGFDGTPPLDILETARAQAKAYPTLSWTEGRVVATSGAFDAFEVRIDHGKTFSARRLVIAAGTNDQLADIEGLAACWGKTVLHCPYCHGFEIAGRHWGVLALPEVLGHMIPLYREWTDQLTVFANGEVIPDEARATIDTHHARLVPGPIRRVIETGGVIEAIQTDTETVAIDALFAPPRIAPNGPMAADLGCALMEMPFGSFLAVDAKGATSVRGVFAAGDAATGMHSVNFAIGAGALAGASAHQSLLFPQMFT